MGLNEGGTHPCPGPDCATRVPMNQLACRLHWFQVPQRVRTLVYAAWAGGRGAGTPAHRKAITDAIAFMRPLKPPAQEAKP